jgi:DNA processing protein
MDPQLPYWLATQYFPLTCAKRILQGLTHFSDIKALFEAPRDELIAKGILAHDISFIEKPNWQLVEKDLAWGLLPGRHLMTIEDENYPSLLKEINGPPLVLYIKGDKTILNTTQIAIVGSRHPTALGLSNAKLFAGALAEAGLTITSGLAIGIDGASHKGALLRKGTTIGVLGSGLNHVYPISHLDLVDEILNQKGAIVSEFPLETAPHPYNFPRRNRIISGLSIGTLVVEAALKSGSLITAKLALDEGREVFAIPGSIHHPQTKGCHHLIRQGAKLVETVDDILEEFKAWHGMKAKPRSSHRELNLELLDAEHQALLEHIGYEITPIDVIIWRSGLTASDLSSMLLVLEFKGHIKSSPGGYVRKMSVDG